MSTTKKLNIFQVLGSLGKKNPKFYHKLSEDEKKSLHPLVVMRWMSGTADAAQVVLTNEFVNPYVFPLHQHKELLINLISASASGDGGKCNWLKVKGKKIPKLPNLASVVRDFYGYNNRDAINAIPLLDDEDILDMAMQLGRQPDDIRLIKKELKGR